MIENIVDNVKVGIVGAGNVATHLAKGLEQAGVEVVMIYSRLLDHAQALADKTASAKPTNSLNFTAQPHAHIYLIAVPDQAIPELISQAAFPENSIVAHTSGTQPLSVLSRLEGVHTGVFYPLQTFSKEKDIDWSRIPLCLEASSQEGEVILMALAHELSEVVAPMAGDARKQLHVAAVIACNFANHLWGIAEEVMHQAKLPFGLLEPLLEETLAKAMQYPPFSVQTGPAQRNDQSTIQAHLQLLEALPQYQHLYKVLTDSIQTTAISRSSQDKIA